MEYVKIFICSFKTGVLINGNRGNGLQFFLRIGTAPFSLQLGYTEQPQKMQITSLKNSLSTFNFVPVGFVPS